MPKLGVIKKQKYNLKHSWESWKSVKYLHILFGFLIVLPNIAMSGCSNVEVTTNEPDKSQRIHQVMPAILSGSQAVVEYTRFLDADDEVNGSIMITDAIIEFIDWATPWTFEALAPDGTLIDSVTINFEDDQYYAFNFKAKTQGVYTIRAMHRSISDRELDIVINPGGWTLNESYGE